MWQHPRLSIVLVIALVAIATGANAPATAASFQDWLRSVHFSPPTFSFATPAVQGVDNVTLAGGSCTGLLVRSVNMQDRSAGPMLFLAFEISGVDVQCVMSDNATALTADVAFSAAWVSASVVVMPYFGFGKPLPIAVMMSDCQTSLQVSSLHFSGASSEIVARFDANKTAVAEELKESLHAFLCTQIPQTVSTMGSNLLQNVAFLAAELLNPRPPPPPPQAVAPIMDWGVYPPIRLGKAMLVDRVSRLSSKPLRSQLGASLGVTPDFTIWLDALEVAGLDTIPVSSLMLTGSNGTMDVSASLSHLSVSVASRFDVSPMPQQQLQGLVQSLNLTVSISDLFLFVQAIAMLSDPMFHEMDVPQLQLPGCYVECARSAADPPIGSVGVRRMRANMTDFALHLGVPGTSLAADLAAVVEALLGAVFQGYLPTMVAIINGLSGFLFTSLNDKLWNHLTADNSTKYPCKQSEGLEGVVGATALKGLWGTSIGLALAGVAAAAGLAAAMVLRKGGAGGGAVASAGGVGGGVHQAGNEDPEASAPAAVNGGEAVVVNGDVCLAKSEVPRPLALFFPLAVVAVMFLFLFADLDLGTSVDVLISAGGDSVTFGSLFTFSLISTITSTWNAKAYAISVLTLLFSGLWPLAKLALMLLAWLAPPRRISLKTRGALLSFLDVWGKYSFLDSWFLVLCMSAFAMKWEGGDAALKVFTRPTAAYYAFLLATVLSLLLGNVASFYHRRSVAKAVSPGEGRGAATGPRIALGRDGHVTPTYLAVTLLLLLSTVVTVAGALVTSFEFGMTGLGADLIFQESRHTDAYSLMSAGIGVTASSPEDAGLVALQAVFLLISFAVPIMVLVALLALWVLPLQAQQQDALLYACHVLDSWSTMDVFVVVIVIGHAEFGQLAGRLIATGSLKSLCGIVEDFNMHCMELDLQFLPGFALLLTAGLVALAVPKSVHQLCRATIEARDARRAKAEAHEKEDLGSRAEGEHGNGVQPSESQRSGLDRI